MTNNEYSCKDCMQFDFCIYARIIGGNEKCKDYSPNKILEPKRAKLKKRINSIYGVYKEGDNND